MLGGRQVTRFKREGEQYDVIVQVADVDRTNPDDLPTIYVRGRDGEMVQLSNLVNIERDGGAEGAQPLQPAARGDDHRATSPPAIRLGEALDFLRKAARRGRCRTPCRPTTRASRASSGKPSSDIYLTFVLALAFIYLVLAAQFESFVDPFIIMLTVPLSMTGALLAL